MGRALRCCISLGLLGFALGLAAVAARAEKQESLRATGYVNDFAGVLDSASSANLTSICREVDAKTGAQIAVVTVHTLEGVPIENFANQLFHRWGIGHKGDSRGVLILLAVNDHKYRIEVGYGLEPILPDGKVGGFGRDVVPLLRQANYRGALLALTRGVALAIAAEKGITLASLAAQPEPAPPPPSPLQPSSSHTENSPFFAVGLLVVLSVILMGVFFVSAIYASIKATWWKLFGSPRLQRMTWWQLWWKSWRWKSSPRGNSSGSGWFGGGWSGGGSGSGGFDGGSSGDFGGFDGGDSGGGGASGDW